VAAFLYAQLENLDEIQRKRNQIWKLYYQFLLPLLHKGLIRLPQIPEYATNNAHMFYVVCANVKERDGLIYTLKNKNIMAVFHYLSLHKSTYYSAKHDGRLLPVCDNYSDCLLRLPFYFELSTDDITLISHTILNYFSVEEDVKKIKNKTHLNTTSN
jgi:dTDP-4-amino-4,6-dideoxygalactose transaminase